MMTIKRENGAVDDGRNVSCHKESVNVLKRATDTGSYQLDLSNELEKVRIPQLEYILYASSSVTRGVAV